MASQHQCKDRSLIATIGDEDTITGLLLAGTGHVDARGKKNFMVVTWKTPVATIESAFAEYTDRSDIAIVLINQHIADQIRPLVEKYERAFPALLEIPSKDHPYGRCLQRDDLPTDDTLIVALFLPADPSKDSVLKRVKKLFGE